MRLSDFELIVVLSEEGTMRKASDRLYISQPALSQRLQLIEHEWNTQLFIRSRRGLSLTAEGETVVQFARELLTRLDDIRDKVRTQKAEIHGTLKIAVSSVNGQYWLPDVLKTFVAQHPLVQIALTTGWSSEIMDHMYHSECHVAIVRGTPKWSGGKLCLFSDPLYFVDSKITNLSEVIHEDRPYIQFRSDSSYDQVIQNWWHAQNLRVPARTIMVDQIETCKQMVTHGIGYAILPLISLAKSDQVHRLPLLDRRGQPIVRDNWLLYDTETLELNQVRAFVDVVKHRLFRKN